MSQNPYFMMNFSHQNAQSTLNSGKKAKTMNQNCKFFFADTEKTPKRQGKFDD